MIRYVVKDYIGNTLLSSRFILFIIILYLAMFSLFQNMGKAMGRLGYMVGPLEMLPCFVHYDANVIIYFGLFVFLISIYPKWDGSLNQISRMGKRKWLCTQYVYVFMTSIVYFLVWTIGFIFAFLPQITWTNEWSSFMLRAIDMTQFATFPTDFQTNVMMNYSELLVAIGSPMKVYLLTFLLHVIAGTFIGTLTITLNVCFRRGAGTVVSFLFIAAKAFFSVLPQFLSKNMFTVEMFKKIKNLLKRMEFYISPLYQCDLHIMAVHNVRPIQERVFIGVAYFLILMVIIIFFGMKLVKRVDLSQE